MTARAALDAGPGFEAGSFFYLLDFGKSLPKVLPTLVPIRGWLRAICTRVGFLEMITDERLDRIEELLPQILQYKTVKDWYMSAEVAEILVKAEFTVREWMRLGRVNAERRLSIWTPTRSAEAAAAPSPSVRPSREAPPRRVLARSFPSITIRRRIRWRGMNS